MTIYARQNDDGSWRLWVNSHGMDSPAGTRLNRGALFPQETLHDHEDEAAVAHTDLNEPLECRLQSAS